MRRQQFQWTQWCTLIVTVVGLSCAGCNGSQSPESATAKSEIERRPVPSPGAQATPNRPLPQESPAKKQGAASQGEREQIIGAYFTRKARTMLAGSHCPPESKLVEILDVAYGDLDGDGEDEAAVTAMSCLAGQVPDLSAVLKFGPGSKVRELPFAKEDPNKVFPHMNPQADVRGAPRTTIEDGRLVDARGIYKPGDPNCCPTGGTRRYFHRWNGRELILEDVVDSPDVMN